MPWGDYRGKTIGREKEEIIGTEEEIRKRMLPVDKLENIYI